MSESGLDIEANSQEPLDQELYDWLTENASFQAYEYLNGSSDARDTERVNFINGTKSNPDLDYPDLDIDKLDELDGILTAKKRDIVANEDNEIVMKAYRWKLNEKIAEVRLLKAAQTGDMRRFQRYSRFVYGEPSPEIFNYTIRKIYDKAIINSGSENPELRESATRLLERLTVPDEKGHAIDPPVENESFSEFRTKTKALADALFDNNEQNGSLLSAENVKTAFDIALERISADGWSSVISESTRSVSTNQEEQKMLIPSDKEISVRRLAELIVHEIGTHVQRRVNGERSRLKLLGLGLDRYEIGEEGIATAREQALSSGVKDFSSLDGHLAIGLAVGIDGEPRDFRDVYEFLKNYFEMSNLESGVSADEAGKKAEDKAWKRCVRTFRGTDCKTKGVCFTKDIIYREGNIGIWRVFNENSKEVLRFDVGKYDPANSRHLLILEQLGITDDDLEELKT